MLGRMPGKTCSTSAVAAASCVHMSCFVYSNTVIHGFVDDYTFMVRACLDMYESLHDEQWLEWAMALQDVQDALFWDENDSAYFTATLDDPSVILRLKEGLLLLIG